MVQINLGCCACTEKKLSFFLANYFSGLYPDPMYY